MTASISACCKAIELMKANVSERICFDDVARSVGLSRPHFFALFKEQTSLTPNVYWNTLRMQEALRQLQWSREPLTSVAWNLGFTTQGNFTRFFRDHAGVPPTLYREAAAKRRLIFRRIDKRSRRIDKRAAIARASLPAEHRGRIACRK